MKTAAKPMYFFLLVLAVGSTVGLQAWRTLFDNFAVHGAGLEGSHVGVIQSVREIPGLLSFLVVYLLLFLSEHRLAALAVAVTGLGLGLTGVFPSFLGITLTTLVMSLGFHYFEATVWSLTLQYFDPASAPMVAARIRAATAASSIGAGLIIWGLSYVLGFAPLYAVMGVLVMAAGVWALGRDPSEKGLPPQRKKVVLKREYGLFYLLTFLSGARRQVFVAFASFLMVKKFGFTIPEITLLFVANNALNWWLNPWVGRAIVRYGERWVLSAEYGSLVLLFVAYALVSDKALVGFLYVVDNVFFNFYLAINTYFQKIADPRDIAPSMAVGSAINHITAVVLPALGGLIWMIDYRIIFYSGAVLAFLTFMVAQWVPAKPDEKQVTEQS